MAAITLVRRIANDIVASACGYDEFVSAACAFIFDMDGVLIDSTAAHTEAWRLYLNRHGVEMSDIAARMLGKHNDEIVREFFAGRDLSAEEALRHASEKERLYREIMRPVFESRLVAGVVDFIRRHPGIPMAIASNAEAANVDFVLESAGIRGYFACVVNGHDVARPKPFPDIFLRAAELLGVPAECCIVFEDSETGVAAARAAGMRVVALLTTLHKFDNVELTIADFTDPRLDEWLTPLLPS
jgi:beta-phosphoglucomutase family hydrolase